MDKQTLELIREISKMAERVGARFVPDPKKIAAFGAAHSNGMLRGENDVR